jgi:serine/threonine protein phosphatase 1
MSDIHGQYTAFLHMLDLIHFTSRDRLCVLGDAIDRGPDGIAVLQHIMRTPNITMILGNHENMMLEAIVGEQGKSYSWFHNGFEPTIRAFDKLSNNEKHEILIYISRLKLQHTITAAERKFTLVHGRPKLTAAEEKRLILRSKAGDYGRSEFDRRIWSEFVPDAIKREGVTFVFGHRMTSRYQNARPLEIYFGDGCIGIDCGCARGGYPGRLGCLRLEDLQTFYAELE